MKREVYEKQKIFAGEKKPSMLRRCIDHDYTDRQMYLVTMVTENRRPLFGRVTGHSDAAAGSEASPSAAPNASLSTKWQDSSVKPPANPSLL